MASTTASVSINVPQEEIRQHIMLAVGEALTKNKSALVEAIVKESLTKPANSYGPAPLEIAVKGLIAEETKRAVSEWIEAHRDSVRSLVAAALKKNDFANAIADAVTLSALSHVYATVSANVTLVRKESDES